MIDLEMKIDNLIGGKRWERVKKGEKWKRVGKDVEKGEMGKGGTLRRASGQERGSTSGQRQRQRLRCYFVEMLQRKSQRWKKTWLRASVDSGYPYFSFLLHKLTTKKCKYAGIQIKDPYVVLLCRKIKVRDGKN